MHIFLTGDKQAGKTTIIWEFLSRSGLRADGFMTYWEPVYSAERAEASVANDSLRGSSPDGAGGRNLYLSPFSMEPHSVKRHLVMREGRRELPPAENRMRTSDPGIFDVHGTEILGNSGRLDVIVMDELGFLESESALFQQAVLRRLSGEVPILGVIQPAPTEFLDRVRGHPRVTLREIRPDNRDMILTWLLSRNWGTTQIGDISTCR
jgi:nucleoside-triphosphatase THEP1